MHRRAGGRAGGHECQTVCKHVCVNEYAHVHRHVCSHVRMMSRLRPHMCPAVVGRSIERRELAPPRLGPSRDLFKKYLDAFSARSRVRVCVRACGAGGSHPKKKNSEGPDAMKKKIP